MYLSQGSWLLPSRGRRGMAAERGLGLWGLTAPKAVTGVEALLLRGRGGGLPSLLGPAPLLPALPPAACCPIPWGRWGARPRGAVGRWPGENGSQPRGWGWGTQTSPRPGSSGPAGFPGKGGRWSCLHTQGCPWGHELQKGRRSQRDSWTPTGATTPRESLARTAICVCRQAGPLLQRLLLPVPAAMAAVVVVGGGLAGWSAVQGRVAQMSHVGPLGCQCGDGALHGAGIWVWLWAGTWVGSQSESGVQPSGSSHAMGAGRPQDTSHQEEWAWGSIPEAGVSPQTGQAEPPGGWGWGKDGA